jgi:hypothetical protein
VLYQNIDVRTIKKLKKIASDDYEELTFKEIDDIREACYRAIKGINDAR